MADLDQRTVDHIRFGEQQSEKDHELNGNNTGVGTHMDRNFRDAPNGGWFRFTVKSSDQPLQLLNVHNGGDRGNRSFEIFVDDVKIATETLNGSSPGNYIEKMYGIPTELTRGKKTVVVKFQGLPGKIAGAFFESRIIR